MSYSLDAIYKTSSWAIAKNSMALASLQQKAATGLNVLRVSDDPSASNKILGLQRDSRTKQQYLNTLDEAVSILDLSSSVIQSITTEISRARTSLTATLSGTTSSATRNTLAEDLNNALEQLVSLCNTERLGQYLFAGANSDTPPYTVERDSSGNITRVVYQGSDEEQSVEVVSGMKMSALLVGNNLFRMDTRTTPMFYGSTGAAAGTGTNSVRGNILLTVAGAPGNYQLSIDGGKSWVSATGSETNIPVIHSETGEVLYVDTTGITQTGTEPIRVTGTYDLFNVLIGARDLLNNTEGLPEDQILTMLLDTVKDVQEVETKIVRGLPIVGGRIQTLTNLRDSIDEMKMNTDDEISRLSDADVTQVAIDLARYEVLYEMSLNVAAKMFSMSLLNFLD
jgi:flagellar hook-associated protein 3 FlgL